MINPFKEINWKPSRSDLRKFAWSLMLGFPGLALVFFLVRCLKAHELPSAGNFVTLAGTGAAIGLICYFAPFIAKPLYYVWYGLGACVGLVMANLLFTLMYFLVFTPMGLASRILGRDALNLQWKKGAASHWKDAVPAPTAIQYFKQY